MTIRELILVNPGATDAEVVKLWGELPPVTAHAIPLKALGEYLREVGLMAALKAVAADPATDAAVRYGLADFLDQLADVRAVNLDTTNLRIALRSAAVLQGLAPVAAGIGLDPAEVTAAIYALGGGLAYPPIGEAAVKQERELMAEEAEAAEEKAQLDAAWEKRRAVCTALSNLVGLRNAAGMNVLNRAIADLTIPEPTLADVEAAMAAVKLEA